MKIIVNADDYGYDANSTKAIRQCFIDGLISQTTLIVNTPNCEDAIEVAKKDGFIDRVGLHVNLSEGQPLSSEMKKNSFFCNKDGFFSGKIRESRMWRFFLPSEEKRVIASEIIAQMKRFRELGLSFDHYDSHGHVCTFPSILPIALECARECGFRSTRIYINMSGNHFGKRMSCARRMFCSAVERKISKARFIHSDKLGYAWDLQMQLDSLDRDSSVEVLCHPNYRLSDLTRSNEGVLMDWKRPIEDSLGWLKDVKKFTFGTI